MTVIILVACHLDAEHTPIMITVRVISEEKELVFEGLTSTQNCTSFQVIAHPDDE